MALRQIFGACVLAAGFGVMAGGEAAAQGLSDLHSHVRVGNRVCFADHFHTGNSGGQSSRRAAERAAIQSWQDFTGFEYGAAWGRFSLAASKSVRCSPSGSSWSCEVAARPCRRR